MNRSILLLLLFLALGACENDGLENNRPEEPGEVRNDTIGDVQNTLHDQQKLPEYNEEN